LKKLLCFKIIVYNMIEIRVIKDNSELRNEQAPVESRSANFSEEKKTDSSMFETSDDEPNYNKPGCQKPSRKFSSSIFETWDEGCQKPLRQFSSLPHINFEIERWRLVRKKDKEALEALKQEIEDDEFMFNKGRYGETILH